MTTNTSKKQCAKACNKLLRGELSAIETYKQALEKFSHEDRASLLRSLLVEHEKAAASLRENVRVMGESPEKSSGLWGEFAKLAEGAAHLFGDKAAVSALIHGEEKGRDQYREALIDEDVLPECREMIRRSLLPRQLDHISTLENLRQEIS